MIRFTDVAKRYPEGFEALSGVSFQLERGEMAFLTGPSGAGKSTLLKLVTAIEKPSAGKLSLMGLDIGALKPRDVPFLRRHMGIIFQNHRLLMDRTVFDNVALPLHMAGVPHKDMAKRVRAALDKVGLLDKEKLNPVVLSGGEQQRVGIARAVVGKPAILIADEPTGNLDPALAADVMRLFEQFNQVGTTVLVASHDLALIARLRHRTLYLKQGRLVSDGLEGAV
ncbi:MAG: cell division ATP-binding protein FtsE [Gammaproteobacteria bacterium]|nr:cell division ATP-binding protein FtsE [Gammaproteobacteria bacterium]